MKDGYSIHVEDLNKKLTEYQDEMEKIMNFSKSISSDIVKYTLREIRKDENLEICRIVIEVVLKHKQPLAGVLKIIIKLLYLLKTSPRYEHNGYYVAKKFIDDVLADVNNTTAKLAKKKYELILASILKENVDDQLKNRKFKNKAGASADIKDNITRGYIHFV